MTTFSPTKKEFHQEAKVFFDALPTLDDEQMDGGLDALGLLYLGVNVDNERELNECARIYQIAYRKVMEKRLEDVNKR